MLAGWGGCSMFACRTIKLRQPQRHFRICARRCRCRCCCRSCAAVMLTPCGREATIFVMMPASHTLVSDSRKDTAPLCCACVSDILKSWFHYECGRACTMRWLAVWPACDECKATAVAASSASAWVCVVSRVVWRSRLHTESAASRLWDTCCSRELRTHVRSNWAQKMLCVGRVENYSAMMISVIAVGQIEKITRCVNQTL